MTQSLIGKSPEYERVVKLEIEDGYIREITFPENETTDLYIGPGLIDAQINGYAGVDFNTYPLAAEDIKSVCMLLAKNGVTAFYPTVITNSVEVIGKIVEVIALACEMDAFVASMIPGIHLEGPFLSPQDGARGAHAKEFTCAPNWEAFAAIQERAHGLIKILTLSPEWEEAEDFIRTCREKYPEVIISIGHTMATPEQIKAAVEEGACMSTHLGNGAPAMLPRHPNFIWEQLANDNLTAGVIADGYHLPASVLKTFLRAKEDRIFIVSDAVFLSGKAPGRYTTHIGGDVILSEEGRLCTAEDTRLLAGSVKILSQEISFLVKNDVVSLARAWDLASRKPAEFLGLEKQGKLEVGKQADIVLFSMEEGQVQVKAVYKMGEKVL